MQHQQETKPQAKPQAKQPEPEPLTPAAIRSSVSWIRIAAGLGHPVTHNAMIGEKRVVAQVEEDYGMSGMKVYGVVGGRMGSYSLLRDAKVAAVDLAARSLPPAPPPKAAVSPATTTHQ